MKLRTLLVSIFLLPAAAEAQTSPAEMGITPTTTPEHVQVLDRTNTWSDIGTVDPTTHIFTPVGGGGGGGGTATPQAPPVVNVTSIGMQASPAGAYVGSTAFDNAPLLNALYTANGLGNNGGVASIGGTIVFPPLNAQTNLGWYLSRSIDLFQLRTTVDCGNPMNSVLVFAPGIDGLIVHDNNTSPNVPYAGGAGGYGQDNDIRNCKIASLGEGNGYSWSGIPYAYYINLANYGGIYAPPFTVGDGIIAATYNGPRKGVLNVTPGAYTSDLWGGTYVPVASVSGAAVTLTAACPSYTLDLVHHVIDHQSGPPNADLGPALSCVGSVLTLANPAPASLVPGHVVNIPAAAGTVGTSFNVTLANGGLFSNMDSATNATFMSILRLPASRAYNATTIVGSQTVVTSGGPGDYVFQSGDPIWTDGFPYGAMVEVAYSLAPYHVLAWDGAVTVTLSAPCPTNGFGTVFPTQDLTDSSNILSAAASCVGPTLTLKSAPARLPTGELIGVTVGNTSGPVATLSQYQAFLVRGASLSINLTATANHPNLSGKLWKIPVGIQRRVTSRTHNNIISGWGAGLMMTAGTIGGMNDDGSFDEGNQFFSNFVSRWVAGDNTGASTSAFNLYNASAVVDILEGGGVGSVYVGDSNNSGENQQTASLMQNCSAGSQSVYVGMYMGGPGKPVCLASDGSINVTPIAGNGGPLIVGPLAGGTNPDIHAIGNGGMVGGFNFTSHNTDVAASANYAAGVTTISVGTNIFAGMGVADVTNPIAIPPGTVIASRPTISTATLSNPIVAPGIATGDVLRYSNVAGTSSACIRINPGYLSGGMFWDKQCTSAYGWNLTYSGYWNAWALWPSSAGSADNTPAMLWANLDFWGYASNSIDYQNGLFLSAGFAQPGTERWIDESTATPTIVNNTATAAAPFNTSNKVIPVVACPAAVVHGTVYDATVVGAPILGINGGCAPLSTLTLAAPATHASTGSVDNLVFGTPLTVSATAKFTAFQTTMQLTSCANIVRNQTIFDTSLPGSPQIGVVLSCVGTTLTNSPNGWDWWLNSFGAADVLQFMTPASGQFTAANTTVPITDCGLAAVGTTVFDYSVAGNPSIGTVSACAPVPTITLSTFAARSSSGAADAIAVTNRRQGDFRFNSSVTAGGSLGWSGVTQGSAFYPGPHVANDVGGTSFPVATPTTIASLVACGATTVGYGTITNGQAIAAAGYGVAVGATTGAATRPVFCDGASWTYH